MSRIRWGDADPRYDPLAFQVHLDEPDPVRESTAWKTRMARQLHPRDLDQRLEQHPIALIEVREGVQNKGAQYVVLLTLDGPGFITVGTYRAAQTTATWRVDGVVARLRLVHTQPTYRQNGWPAAPHARCRPAP